MASPDPSPSAVRYGVFSRSAQERGVLTSEPIVITSNDDGSWPSPYNTSKPSKWSRNLFKMLMAADERREFAREHCRRCHGEVELGVLTEPDLLCPTCAPVSDAEYWGAFKTKIEAHFAEGASDGA
jgi:hypothetical protein